MLGALPSFAVGRAEGCISKDGVGTREMGGGRGTARGAM